MSAENKKKHDLDVIEAPAEQAFKLSGTSIAHGIHDGLKFLRENGGQKSTLAQWYRELAQELAPTIPVTYSEEHQEFRVVATAFNRRIKSLPRPRRASLRPLRRSLTLRRAPSP
jgi:hypothetical protein